MTPKELRTAWENVEAKASPSAAGAYLHLQILGGDLPIGVIVRSADRQPGLLVQFREKDMRRMPKPNAGRGFSFERVVQFGPHSFGLPIILGDMSGLDIFAMMGSDLISVVERSDGKVPAVELVLNRISLWRQFMQKRGGRMTDEEVRGLFGELQIFERLTNAVGADASLAAWHGPERELLDYHLPARFIEVKTWRIDGGAKISISHPNQLAVDSNRPIYIVAVQISVGGNGGQSLPEYVRELRSKIPGLGAQRFDELLAAYGYMESQADDYPEKFTALDVSGYEVRPGFPFIDSRAVPGGISDLRYSIEIGALAPFQVDANAILLP